MRISTLRPGLMVQVRTSITGNVKYKTQTLKADYTTEDGERKAEWATERTVRNPQEHEDAVKARSAIRSRIQGICIQSNAFSLSCLEDKADELDLAIKEANAIADDFNRVAEVTRLIAYITVYRIEQDDARACAAINRNIRELMDTMAEGFQTLDVDKVRQAANDARQLAGMLTDSAKAEVQEAIELARKAARQLKTAAEQGAAKIDLVTIERLKEARTSFLDLDDAQDIETVETEGRGLDLEPEPVEIKAAPASSPMFDL